jgi:hypothetical protein
MAFRALDKYKEIEVGDMIQMDCTHADNDAFFINRLIRITKKEEK